MRTAFELTLGFTVAAGLLVATVVLWVHNLIIFAAPVGFLAAGSVWVAIDNTLIYPKHRAAQAAASGGEGAAAPEQDEPQRPAGINARS